MKGKIFPSSTLYDILGLSPTCTKQEIKSQFYKLSLLYHPDRYQLVQSIDLKNKQELDSEWYRQRFIQINQAYSILSNELERIRYDQQLGINTTIGGRRDTTVSGLRHQNTGNRPIWDPFPGFRHTTATHHGEQQYHEIYRRYQRARPRPSPLSSAKVNRDNGWNHVQQAQHTSSQEQAESSLIKRRRWLVIAFMVGIYFYSNSYHSF